VAGDLLRVLEHDGHDRPPWFDRMIGQKIVHSMSLALVPCVDDGCAAM
jgi:hypothetical protein